MNMNVAEYELNVAKGRIEDMRLEIANNRIAAAISRSTGGNNSPRALALFDAVVARASQGAARRHSARNGRQWPV